MYTIVQFSPTGNSKYIAEAIGNALEYKGVIHPIEHISTNELSEASHLIIVYAIHAFNAPRTVKRFIRDLPEGFSKHVSLVGVGCNTSWVNDAVSKDIKSVLEQKSYQVIVDEVVAMPLTFIMSFPEQLIQEQIRVAEEEVIRLTNAIKNLRKTTKKISIKSNILHYIGRVEPFASRFFGLELHVKKGCIQCGLCVQECPEKNIRITENGKIRIGFNCMMCMRCIYHCPKGVITPRISKFIPIKHGYSLENHLKKGD